jgi:hypothetical protein
MRTRLFACLAVTLLTVAVAACGSSSTETKPATTAESAETQVKHSWESFFSPSTSAAEKEALLQNGSQFSSVIKAATGNPLASQVSATVNSVKLTGPTTATVEYTISLAGKPVLKNATGRAVKSGDTWLVGDVSFCQLLRLEGASAAACSKA